MRKDRFLHFGTIVGFLLCLTLGGCGTPQAAAVCQAAGVCDEPAPDAERIDVLCDISEGSTCSPGSMGETLDVVLPYAADRPGSTVHVWALGATLGDTRLVAPPLHSEVAGRAGTRARKRHREQFVTSSKGYFMRVMEPVFAAPVHRSPLAEGLAKVALSREEGVRGRVIVLTDGREVSRFGDFECRDLPDVESFLETLQAEGVLSADTLAGVRITFSFVSLGPVAQRRCPATVARARGIEALWRAAAERAGAVGVDFTTGVANPSLIELMASVGRER